MPPLIVVGRNFSNAFVDYALVFSSHFVVDVINLIYRFNKLRMLYYKHNFPFKTEKQVIRAHSREIASMFEVTL